MPVVKESILAERSSSDSDIASGIFGTFPWRISAAGTLYIEAYRHGQAILDKLRR